MDRNIFCKYSDMHHYFILLISHGLEIVNVQTYFDLVPSNFGRWTLIPGELGSYNNFPP